MSSAKQILANQQNALKSTGPKSIEGKATVARNAVSHGVLSKIAVISQVEKTKDWEAHLTGLMESLAPAGYLETMLVERIALLSWRQFRLMRYEREIIAARQEDVEVDLAKRRRYDSNIKYHHPNDVEWNAEVTGRGLRLLKRLPQLPDSTSISVNEACEIVEGIARLKDVNVDDITIPGIPDDAAISEIDWTVALLRSVINAIAFETGCELEELLSDSIRSAELYYQTAKSELERVRNQIDRMRAERLIPQEQVDCQDLSQIQRYEAHLSKHFYQALHELQRLQAARVGNPAAIPIAVDLMIDEAGKER